MKKLLMRGSAVIAVGLGAWLVAVPVLAAYHKCITDGDELGPHEEHWGCEFTNPATHSGCGGDCGGKKWERGYYCADGGNQTQCIEKPSQEVKVERCSGNCYVHTVPAGDAVATTCRCNVTINWYLSSEKEWAGRCATVSAQSAPTSDQ